jgi:hypothetical protein
MAAFGDRIGGPKSGAIFPTPGDPVDSRIVALLVAPPRGVRKERARDGEKITWRSVRIEFGTLSTCSSRDRFPAKTAIIDWSGSGSSLKPPPGRPVGRTFQKNKTTNTYLTRDD